RWRQCREFGTQPVGHGSQPTGLHDAGIPPIQFRSTSRTAHGLTAGDRPLPIDGCAADRARGLEAPAGGEDAPAKEPPREAATNATDDTLPSAQLCRYGVLRPRLVVTQAVVEPENGAVERAR